MVRQFQKLKDEKKKKKIADTEEAGRRKLKEGRHNQNLPSSSFGGKWAKGKELGDKKLIEKVEEAPLLGKEPLKTENLKGVSKFIAEKAIPSKTVEGNPFQEAQGVATKIGVGLAAGELAGAAIGAAGAAGAVATTRGLTKLSSSKNILSIQRMKAMFPKANDKVIKSAIRKFNSASADDIVKQLAKKPLVTRLLSGKNILKTGAFVGSGLVGTDLITTWYALDNVASGGKFTIGDALEALQNGTRTPEEVQDYFDENDKLYNEAVKKVELSTTYNPFMWASAKLLMAGVLQDRETYLIKRDNFVSTQGEGGQ